MTRFSKSLSLCACFVPLSLLGQTLQPSQRVGDVNNKGQFIVGSNNKIIYVNAPQDPPRRDLKSIGLVVPLRLHHLFEMQSAVYEFEGYKSKGVGKPDKYRLLDSRQLQARTLILSALKRYAQSLADLQEGVNTFHEDDLQIGQELESFAVSGQKTLLDEFPGSPEATATLAASLSALGQYLVSKRAKADEARLVQAMEPVVRNLCSFIEADINILREKSKRDFTAMAEEQLFFVRTTSNLSGVERRDEISKLPAIYETSDSIDDSLNNLVTAIKSFASAHRYMSVQSQGKRYLQKNQITRLLVASESL